MDVRPADILVMKKPHPCGSQTMYVIRAGMDFKLRCEGCGREFMTVCAADAGIQAYAADHGEVSRIFAGTA